MILQAMFESNMLTFVLICCVSFYSVVGQTMSDNDDDNPLAFAAEAGSGEDQLPDPTNPSPISTTPFPTEQSTIDLCDPNPCRNSGTCKVEKGAVKCECAGNFKGDYCRLIEGSCDQYPCAENTDCVNVVSEGAHVCVCKGNFKGDNCDKTDVLIQCRSSLSATYTTSDGSAISSTPVCFRTQANGNVDKDVCVDPDDRIRYEVGDNVVEALLLPPDSQEQVCAIVPIDPDVERTCLDIIAFEADDYHYRPWRNATVHVCVSRDMPPVINPMNQVTYNVDEDLENQKTWHISASDPNGDVLRYGLNGTDPKQYLQYFNIDKDSGKVTLNSIPSIAESQLVRLTVTVEQINNGEQSALADVDVRFLNFTISCPQEDIVIGLRNEPQNDIMQIQCTSSVSNYNVTYTYDFQVAETKNLTLSEDGVLSLRWNLTRAQEIYILVFAKGTLDIDNDTTLVAQANVVFFLLVGYFEPSCTLQTTEPFSKDSTVGTCKLAYVCSSEKYGTTPTCTDMELTSFSIGCDIGDKSSEIKVCSTTTLTGAEGDQNTTFEVSNEYGTTELVIPISVNIALAFVGAPYTIPLKEDMAIGTGFFTGYYTSDTDITSIRITDDNSPFSVALSSTVEFGFTLTLEEKMNVALVQYYNFNIRIEDKSGAFAEAEVAVNVEDVNDPPVCTSEDPLIVTLDHVTLYPVGKEVAKLECHDPDFKTLSYTIIDSDVPFTVNTSGSIIVKTQLSHDVTTFLFVVRVTDGGNNDTSVAVKLTFSQIFSTTTSTTLPTTSTLTSTELTIPPGPLPICSSKEIVKEISARSLAGTCLTFESQCTESQSSSSALTYELSQPSEVDIFQLTTESGNMKLCHEKSLEEADSQWSATVIVRGTYGDAFISLVINISSEVHLPVFQASEYNVTVTEDSTVGVIILYIMAIDEDLLGTLQYSLEDNPYFTIDPILGKIGVASKLNASDVHLLDLTVKVVDSLDPASTADARVVITIQDVNEVPICPPSVSFTVDIDVTPGFQIGAVQCYDTDIQADYKTLNYSITGTESDSFTINSFTGLVMITSGLVGGPLKYVFSVNAEDGGNLKSTVAVTVNISSNHPPICGEDILKRTVNEKITECFQMDTPCSDSLGTDFALNFTLEDDFFYVGVADDGAVNSLKLCPKHSLSVGILNLNVKVIGQYGSVDINVEITVQDVNYPPHFSANVYKISVSEDLIVGSTLHMVQASDEDTGVNGQLQYSIGNPMFSINSNGMLFLEQPLNASEVDFYSLNITVVDGGGLSATALLEITVVDLNEPPSCPSSIQIFLNLTTPIDTILGEAGCTDVDKEEDYKTIVYNYSPDESMPLSVKEDTGEVYVSSAIPKTLDSYNFPLTVLDKEMQTQGQDGISVIVVVTVNTNFPPTCSSTDMSVKIPESNIVASYCLSPAIICADPTGGELNIQSQEGDGLTVMIVMNKKKDDSNDLVLNLCSMDSPSYQQLKNYTVVVRVSNGIGETDVTWTFEVTDVNDPPQFSQNHYNTSIPEDASIGSTYLFVSVSDEDISPEFGAGAISDVSENPPTEISFETFCNCFQVKSALNATKNARYEFQLQVVDGGGLTATATAVIQVTDVNESPICDVINNELSLSTTILVSVGQKLGSLPCYDYDLDPENKKLKYIASGKDAGYFSVNENGEIAVATNLPRMSQSLSFMVTVSDSSSNPEDTTVMISIAVDNSIAAECSPTFRYPDEWLVDSCLEMSLNCEDATLAGTDHLTYSKSGNYTIGFTEMSDTNQDTIKLCYDLTYSGTFEITVGVNNGLKVSTYTENIIVEYLASTPTFIESLYEASIEETAAVGFIIVTVSATVSATASKRGDIVYSIVGSPDTNNWENLFAINPASGTITTLKSVASLVTQTVTLKVEAMHNASKLKSTVNVEISVIDVNEAPSCVIGDGIITIELADPVDTTVKMFPCTDPDVSEENKFLVYNIAGKNVNSQYFKIVQTGSVVNIKVRTPLAVNIPAYELEIQVSDTGSPPKTVTYSIRININLIPAAPLVSATAIDSHTVQVEWSYERDKFLEITNKFELTVRGGEKVTTLAVAGDQSSTELTDLNPETNYVIAVSGIVTNGITPSGSVTIRTPAIPVIAKMMVSIRLSGKEYIAAYADKTSVEFLAEEQLLINNLKPVLERVLIGFEEVKIVSLREGSVIVDFVLSVNLKQNGNLETAKEKLRKEVVSAWIGTLSVDPNYFETFEGDGFIDVVDLTSSSSELLAGKDVRFSCQTDVVGNVDGVVFSWYLESNLVQPLNSRITFSQDKLSSSRVIGYMDFNPIMEKDAGILRCSAANGDGKMVSNQEMSVSVTARARVTLVPLSGSIGPQQSLNLTCTINKVAVIFWRLNDTVFSGTTDIEIIRLSGRSQQLFIKKLQATSTFTCGALSAEHDFESVTAIIGVSEGIRDCPSSSDHRETVWKESMPDFLNLRDCPEGLSGRMSRMCGRDGTWQVADYDNCVDPMIQKILNELDDVSDGLNRLQLENTLDVLANVTESRELVSGELEATAKILASILSIENQTGKTDQGNNIEKIIEVASNVIDFQNQGEWKMLLTKNKTGASSIMDVVSQFGEIASKSLQNTDYSKIVARKNIVVEIGRSKPKDLKFPDSEKSDFPSWVKKSQNQYRLYREAIQSALGADTDVSFSSIFYRNLSSIIHHYQGSDSGVKEAKDVAVNSDILSLTLFPKPVRIEPPIQLQFEHIYNYSNPKCSYWNFDVPGTPNGAWSTDGCTVSSSADDLTVCECDHLTNFAVLMSPRVVSIDHTLPLSIISAVGCGISLLCLFMTIGTHMFLWRYVKSDRTIILMNLCVALIAAYLLFVAGVNRTENKDVCTAIAALLHYIYLVVFFLMLAEGIEVAVTVLYVFSTKSRVRWMLPLSWGIPAIIVGISLGVTQLTGYGNQKFCWLSVNDALIFAFIGPALVVILINTVIICAAFRAMFQTSVMLTKSAKQQAKTGLRSLCILLPVMGLTWVFGVFSLNEDLVFFQYLFAICNSLQGLFIFIFHCVLSKQVHEGIAHTRRRKKSLAEFSTRSTSRSAPVKVMKDSDQAEETEKKISPFLEADRQVQEMARKLKKSTDEHNLEDRNNYKPNKDESVINLRDVKISNISSMAKSPLGPSVSDNPSTQTNTTNTGPPEGASSTDTGPTDRDPSLNDLDRTYKDPDSNLEPNIPPIQTHYPESPTNQHPKPLDQKLQRKPYLKWEAEKRSVKPSSSYNISTPTIPIQYQNPVYPTGRVDEIHPARLTTSRLPGTRVDSAHITPVGEDIEELEMRKRHQQYRPYVDKPKKKLRESQERLQIVYNSSHNVFIPEVQGKQYRKEGKTEKLNKHSPKAARKKIPEQPKHGTKSKQPPVTKKQKHGGKRDRDYDRSHDYEYEYAYVPATSHTSLDSVSQAEYLGYHPYGGIRSGTPRYVRSERYDENQFQYPWGDQYVEYW